MPCNFIYGKYITCRVDSRIDQLRTSAHLNVYRNINILSASAHIAREMHITCKRPKSRARENWQYKAWRSRLPQHSNAKNSRAGLFFSYFKFASTTCKNQRRNNFVHLSLQESFQLIKGHADTMVGNSALWKIIGTYSFTSVA